MALQQALNAPPRRQQAIRNDERMLDALEAILEEGTDFDSLNFESIAVRAGLSSKTLYRRFPNKEEMLLHLWVTRISGRMANDLAESVDAHTCEGRTVREIVRGHLRAILDNFKRYRTVTKLVGREIRYGNASEEVVRSNHRLSDQSGRFLRGRLYEHRNEIKHPDLRVATAIPEACAGLYIREWVYAMDSDIAIGEEVEDEESLVNGLTDMFVRHLLVEDEIAPYVNGKEGKPGE